MKHSFFFLAASLGILVACSGFEKDVPVEATDDLEITSIVFNVPPVIDDDVVETRASAVPKSDYNVSFAWEETDRIGIFPNKGSQIYFEPEDGVGTSSASFDGGGWALKSNANYISYYPFVADFDLDRNAIPISFTGQKQKGTDGPFIGERWVLATESTTSQNGKLTFEYNILNTIINVIATLPAGTYTSASLNISEPLFVEEGTFSLDEQKITGTTFSKKLEIELEDFTLTNPGTVPIYFMANSFDWSDKEMTVIITKDDGTRYKCVKTPPGPFNQGKRRGFLCTMQKDADIINFADPEVKRLCVENWDTDGDGELDMAEAAVVTDLGNVFANNSLITTFDELQYFTGLTSIGGNTTDCGFNDCLNLTSVILPNTVSTLDNGSFRFCPLSSFTIPTSITRIKVSALSQNSFTSLTIPEQTIEMEEDAIVSTETDTFSRENITSLSLLGKIKRVYYDYASVGLAGAFRCWNLESIYLGEYFDYDPEGISTISPDVSRFAFRNGLFGLYDFPLESIAVSTDNGKYDSRNNCNAVIETATNTLLMGCSNTVIPEDVTSIAPFAFAYLNNLSTIEIPAAIKEIGNGAFNGESLREIILKPTTPPVLTRILCDRFPADVEYSQDLYPITIYVPAGSVDAYKTADGWSEYADWIRSVEEYVVPDPGDDGNS